MFYGLLVLHGLGRSQTVALKVFYRTAKQLLESKTCLLCLQKQSRLIKQVRSIMFNVFILLCVYALEKGSVADLLLSISKRVECVRGGKRS